MNNIQQQAAYNEGYNHRKNYGRLMDNPYPNQTELYMQWANGYNKKQFELLPEIDLQDLLYQQDDFKKNLANFLLSQNAEIWAQGNKILVNLKEIKSGSMIIQHKNEFSIGEGFGEYCELIRNRGISEYNQQLYNDNFDSYGIPK